MNYYQGIADLAAALRARRIGCVELVDAHLARIDRLNPGINAVVTLDAEGALRRAREADAALGRGETWGPLHGLPFTVKDALATAGVRTTGGSPLLADHVPEADAVAVARVKAAGGILLGKTNVPVLSADAQTDNPVFGRSANPWDRRLTPGGSSGGGAAAVAAGLTPFDLGADLGGSLRIPASFCGVFAFKPTEHRVPTDGHVPPLPGLPPSVRHMNTVGPLAGRLEDLWPVLRALVSGGEEGHPLAPPVPLGEPPRLDPGRLRLAWTPDFGALPVARSVRELLASRVRDLSDAGFVVEERVPEGYDPEAAIAVWGGLVAAERNWAMRPAAERAEISIPTLPEYAETLGRRDRLVVTLDRFFGQWDALLCPATGCTAFGHRPTGQPLEIDGRQVPYHMPMLPFHMGFSVAGNPAAVLPAGLTAEGLPVGLQVVGRRWAEARLFSICRLLAERLPPPPRPPVD